MSAREYAFNNNLIVNGIVNKAIIYGKNGTGKSSLGIAIFDIVHHLTDKTRPPKKYTKFFLNLASTKKYATFKYTFQFDDDEVIYEYAKKDVDSIVYEKLWINNKNVIDYGFTPTRKKFIEETLIKGLNIELSDNKLSVLKYIYRNTPTDVSSVIYKMFKFCENMLWFRSLSDGNMYCGYQNGAASLDELLYSSGKINEFEKFLEENSLNYKLSFVEQRGFHELVATFENGHSAPFSEVASTGTMSLFLYFIWSVSAFKHISFLFIDEFDAFIHYESAEMIVKQLNNTSSFQSILTSHNTYLMQNKLTRPDCCYIMTNNKIKNLFDSTDKEIREAHNLEKMYINGAFNE